MPAHVAYAPPSSRPGSAGRCSVVCVEHDLQQSFGSAHSAAVAACAEHNRRHHPDPRAAQKQLTSLIYTSRASPGFTSADVDAMLTRARDRNRAAGITGMLLLERGSFLQALEGPAARVDELMRRIEDDPRHRQVRVLDRDVREARRFPDWAMARGHVGQVEALPLAGYYEGLLMARGAAEEQGERAAGRAPAARGSRQEKA